MPLRNSENNNKHVLNAVGTPRANGQVERLNRTLLNTLLTRTLEEDLWDRELPNVQFAVNNIPNRSTGKTPNQILFRYGPRRAADIALKDEVSQIPTLLENLITARGQAGREIGAAQLRQKGDFDKKWKPPRTYRPGDLVLIEKQQHATRVSQQFRNSCSGPMVGFTKLSVYCYRYDAIAPS
nr:unnamed protein product [Callosobruchus analis]